MDYFKTIGERTKMKSKTLVRVTAIKREAQSEANLINASLMARKIRRKAVVGLISQSYVKRLTRKGYPLAKKYYAIYVKDIRTAGVSQ